MKPLSLLKTANKQEIKKYMRARGFKGKLLDIIGKDDFA